MNIENTNYMENIIISYFIDIKGLSKEKAFDKYNKGNYNIIKDIKNIEDLGKRICDDWFIPEFIKKYIDFEKIGNDYINEGWVIYQGIAIKDY